MIKENIWYLLLPELKYLGLFWDENETRLKTQYVVFDRTFVIKDKIHNQLVTTVW